MTSGVDKIIGHQHASADGNGPFFTRFYVRVVTRPTANNTIYIHYNAAFTAIAASIQLTTAGALELLDEDGLIGSASSVLTLSTWYRVEIQVDLTGAGSTDIVRARLDGTEFAGASDRNIASGVSVLVLGGNAFAETQTTGDWTFDDFAFNDTSGAAQASFPGEGKIVHLKPNAAGDNAQCARGGTDSGSDFGQVDEITPNDVTDYLICDAANDIVDLGIENASVPGIGANDTIALVQVGLRVRAATAATMTYRVRIKSQASGTLSESATITHVSTTWFTHDDTAPRNYILTSYTDPQAGGAWTAALLDTSQIGAQALDANPDVWVTTLWALVEYTVGGAVIKDVIMRGRVPFPR
jgi:hypothetical protein